MFLLISHTLYFTLKVLSHKVPFWATNFPLIIYHYKFTGAVPWLFLLHPSSHHLLLLASTPTEATPPLKNDFEEHRKASQRSHSTHQQQTTKMLQKPNLGFESLHPSPSSSSPSPRWWCRTCSSTHAHAHALLSSLTLLLYTKRSWLVVSLLYGVLYLLL